MRSFAGAQTAIAPEIQSARGRLQHARPPLDVGANAAQVCLSARERRQSSGSTAPAAPLQSPPPRGPFASRDTQRLPPLLAGTSAEPGSHRSVEEEGTVLQQELAALLALLGPEKPSQFQARRPRPPRGARSGAAVSAREAQQLSKGLVRDLSMQAGSTMNFWRAYKVEGSPRDRKPAWRCPESEETPRLDLSAVVQGEKAMQRAKMKRLIATGRIHDARREATADHGQRPWEEASRNAAETLRSMGKQRKELMRIRRDLERALEAPTPTERARLQGMLGGCLGGDEAQWSSADDEK